MKLLIGLAVLVATTVLVRADFVTFLKEIQSHQDFQTLSTDDKTLFFELVMAAETDTLTELIDRVGLLSVLELVDALSYADASKFSAYLAESLGYHHHKPTNSDVITKRSLAKRDDDSGSDSASSDEDDDNARSSQDNLNGSEQRVWSQIQAAAGTDGLADLIAETDYGTIFGLLENMNEADANQLLNTMETALHQEVSSALVRRNIIGAGSINGGVVSKRTLVKRDDDGDSDSSSSDDDDDDNARISQSNLNDAEKRVWNEIQTAAETDLMTDLIASTDLALIFGLLENMNEADADQLLNTLETELRQKTAAIVTKRDNDNNEFSQLLGTHANYYSNLNDAEKKIWDAMKDASNQNRLTQFIADNGYGVVFSLAENMSITEFNTFIHMLEQQLQKEAAMAATV